MIAQIILLALRVVHLFLSEWLTVITERFREHELIRNDHIKRLINFERVLNLLFNLLRYLVFNLLPLETRFYNFT